MLFPASLVEYPLVTLEVVAASLSFAFIVGLGIPQLWSKKDATSKAEDGELLVSGSFRVQVALNFAMAALALVRTLSHCHVALATVNSAIAWPVVAAMLMKEQKSRLYNQGHSVTLKAFWAASFIHQNIALFLLLEPNSKYGGMILAVGVAEYVVSTLVLLLGLQAPGLKKDETEEDEYDWKLREEEEKKREKANNMLELGPRLKMLMEVVWANRSSFLQLKIPMAVCAATWVVQRILNVYEPLYNSYVFNSINIERSNSTTDEEDETVTTGILQVRWDYVLIASGLQVTEVVAYSLQRAVWGYFQLKMEKILDFQYMRHLHTLSLRWHMCNESFSLHDRGTSSVIMILDYLIFYILPAFFDMAIAVVFLTITVSGRFGFFVFVMALLHQFALSSPISEYKNRIWSLRHQFFEDSWQKISESISNYEIVKVCANEKFELDRYEAGTLEALKKVKKLESKALGLETADSLAEYFGRALSTFLLVNMVSSGDLPIGDYYLIDSYLWRLRGSLGSLKYYVQPMFKQFVDLETMMKTLREEPELQDVENAKELKLTTGTIEFKNVSFGYPEVPVLKEVSFVAQGGKSLGIVGQSGCGKTTIMKLIMRLYDVTSGEILIDGQNVKRVSQSSLRKQVGSVPQNAKILYSETVRENIRYGDVTASDDQVANAAKKACIHDKIIKLPKGYESKFLGSQSINLSGGETQRLAIARSLLKNPKIVLLDEATSSLDSRTERQVQKSLEELCKNRTCIIVTHRLPTVRHAHMIIVLSSEGAIAEQGTHDELVAQKGIYAEMWNSQVGTDREAEEEVGNVDECETD